MNAIVPIDPERLMIRARSHVTMREPFFATLILGLLLREEKSIPMVATDGKHLFYNPSYITKQRFKILQTDICHEALHVAFSHHIRIGNRDPHTWNVAADYAINIILKEFNLEMDDTYLYDPKYKGMTAERIYKILKEEMDKDEIQKKTCCEGLIKPNGEGGKGEEGEDGKGPKTLSAAEINVIESDAKITINQALNEARKHGKLPGNIEALFEDFTEPKVPWQNILRQFLEVVTKNDYCFTRPNRKYLALHGCILPTLHSMDLGAIAVLVDVSSSVDNNLLKEFLDELSGMLTYVNLEKVYLILVDTKVQSVRELTKADLPLKVDVIGRGGTDFVPGFEYLKENGIRTSCIIYFTDMECNSFPEPPDCKVLWCTKTTDKHYINPPFGQVLLIED